MKLRQNIFFPAVLATSAFALLAFGGCGDRQNETRPPAANISVGTEIDDGVVTAKVKSALFADPDVKSFEFKVETRKGEVQLSGFVDNQVQVDRAIAVARSVEGVKSVDNRVALKAGTATVGNTVDDGVITAKVKSALLADPNIKSLDIAVVTRKGMVQLSGFVDNQGQIDRAIEIVRGTEGVQNVGNEMNIKK